MKIKLLLLVTLVNGLILFSCNNNKEQSHYSPLNANQLERKEPQQNAAKGNQDKIPTGSLTQNSADSIGSPVPSPATTNIDWDKKIIKTATVKLEVKDFKNYSASIYKTVKQYGGYIAQEEQNITDEKSENTITIKVPVAQFENMMNQLPGTDAKVIERAITTDDVGDEIADVQSRLEAKKQIRLKYLDFLKQSKNMEEVLQVQNEINNIQETIESAAGRVSFLTHQSAMSTIKLTFYQPSGSYQPIDPSPSFLTRMANAFTTGARWIGDLLIALVSLWPLLLIIGGGFFIYKKLFLTKKNGCIIRKFRAWKKSTL